MSYQYGGFSNAGYKRDVNEDCIIVTPLDTNSILAIVADGAGSKASTLQPAQIAANYVSDSIKRIYEKDKAALYNNADIYLAEAMHAANRIIGSFKIANEELYAGFASSMSCVLLGEGEQPSRSSIAFAHTGNTRIYLLRVGKDNVPKLQQLTKDQTKAQTLLDEDKINVMQYHVHPDRLVITSALGLVTDPPIQTFKGNIRSNDFLLITTDGIHYAIQPEPMMQLVLASSTPEEACTVLARAAEAEKYNDNGSAILIRCLPPPESK